MSDSKQEDEKRKMLADLVAEYRNDADAMDRGELYQPTTEYLRRLLDRIEAAWEREREELDKRISDLEAYAKLWTGRADELRLKCDEFYAKAKPVGNAAAMREALREAIGETCAGCKRDCDDCMNLKSGWMKKAKAALSAPARNCDRFSSVEQARTVYCSECGRIISIWDEVESDLFEAWLFAPAERKGDCDA